jgi:predicted ArsR family transcriptional regulator
MREQAVQVSSDTVGLREGKPGAVFESEDERRALLLRMGTAPSAWVYIDTLARAARMPRDALRLKLEALEQEGLVASKKAPAGRRYRLTDDGRRVRIS